MPEDLLRNDAAEKVKLITDLILNVARQFTCQRSIHRFIGLLIQVAHTSQQRSHAPSAVGISALTLQQNKQPGSQISIHPVKQPHHSSGNTRPVARHVKSVSYGLVLQPVVYRTSHITPRPVAVQSEMLTQQATRSEPHQDPHRHQ